MNVCQICGKKPAARKYCPDCRITANRLKTRENNRKKSAAIVKFCEDCGVQLPEDKKRKFRLCVECRKKRRLNRWFPHRKKRLSVTPIPNIYGDFRDVERWCKRQLAGVDLSKYLPK